MASDPRQVQDLSETLATLRDYSDVMESLRELGATRFTCGDVTVEFSPLPSAPQVTTPTELVRTGVEPLTRDNRPAYDRLFPGGRPALGKAGDA